MKDFTEICSWASMEIRANSAEEALTRIWRSFASASFPYLTQPVDRKPVIGEAAPRRTYLASIWDAVERERFCIDSGRTSTNKGLTGQAYNFVASQVVHTHLQMIPET